MLRGSHLERLHLSPTDEYYPLLAKSLPQIGDTRVTKGMPTWNHKQRALFEFSKFSVSKSII
jgi:hypothetical protein